MKPGIFRRLMNFWPPFLFNSIAVTDITDDWSEVRVRLRLRPWNKNFVRTQFGGNLFAMADPFFMLMGMHRLGDDYYVWDKAGEIEFIAPGKEDVYAHFVMSDEAVEALRAEAANGTKVLRWFEVDITTAQGDLVAKVRKQLYVRQKPRARPA